MLKSLVFCLIWGLFLPLEWACVNSKKSFLKANNEQLVLQGGVIAEDNQPQAGIQIYLDEDSRPLGQSDQKGQFSFLIKAEDLARLRGSVPVERQSFYLYFVDPLSARKGVSKAINFAQRGTESLDLIRLESTAALAGKVVKVTNGGTSSEGLSGGKLKIGPYTQALSADGSFRMEDLPSGRLPLTVELPGAETLSQEETLVAGTTRELTQPLYVFSGAGPSGLLVQIPPDLEFIKKNQVSHRQRSFLVFTSQKAKHLRLHHDKGPSLELLGAKPVGERVDYEFPALQDQKLYYQFADGEKAKWGQTVELKVDLNPFKDLTRPFKDLKDSYNSSTLRLSIEVPAVTVLMRTSEDAAQLVNQPYLPLEKEWVYNFKPRDPSQAMGSEPINRELYIQFKDGSGYESVVYQESIKIRPFEDFSFKVGDGSGFVTQAVVPVNLNLPKNVERMRFAEGLDKVKEAFWVPVQNTYPYQIPPQLDENISFYTINGEKKICVQLQDLNGFMSGVSCQIVAVDIFPIPPGSPFVINGGAPTSTSEIVELTIQVPPNAFEMRIFDTGSIASESINTGQATGSLLVPPPDPRSNIWLPIKNKMIYTFGTRGDKTVYLQFRDPSGLIGSVYTQPISIIPMIEAYGATQMIVNGGAPLTSEPTLVVDFINIPSTAVAQAIWVNIETPFPVDKVWTPVLPSSLVSVNDLGRKTIYAQFRNNDLDLSPVLKKVIDYDPFPAPTLIYSVNGGLGVSNQREVLVNIQGPPTTVGMRFSESSEGLLTEPFLNFQSPYSFPFTGNAGLRRVYAQLKSVTGEESLVLPSQSIYWEPLPITALSAILHGGAAYTRQRYISLACSAPSDAYMMRYSTDASQLSQEPYQVYEQNKNLTLPNNKGDYKVYVQIKTRQGYESGVFYSPAIRYDPLHLSAFNATIGQSTTADPQVSYNLSYPSEAVEMRLSHDMAQLSQESYQAMQSAGNYMLPAADGTYKLYWQFKNSGGYESEVLESVPISLDLP